MTPSTAVQVLIVDDSEDQRMLLRRYFERAGCEVAEASTAADAITSFAANVPDLTVIDLVLPGMDGWELAAQLTATHPESPIAITSVLGEEHYPSQHTALPKPVTSATVRDALQQLVPRWKAA